MLRRMELLDTPVPIVMEDVELALKEGAPEAEDDELVVDETDPVPAILVNVEFALNEGVADMLDELEELPVPNALEEVELILNEGLTETTEDVVLLDMAELVEFALAEGTPEITEELLLELVVVKELLLLMLTGAGEIMRAPRIDLEEEYELLAALLR